MRRIGLLLASTTLALAACNALTGVSDLAPCATCADDAARVPDVGTDARVDPVDSSTLDASVATDSATDAGPDADASPEGCPGGPACERFVFVSSAEYPGNLGGVSGADAKCQALADASTLARVKGRSFRAWVSTAASSTAARFVHGTKPYLRTDLAVVASSWNGLVVGALLNGIAFDENGVNRSGDSAWSATTSKDALFTGTSCLDWTSSTFVEKGTTGNVGGNGSGWSASGDTPCVQPARIYCFER